MADKPGADQRRAEESDEDRPQSDQDVKDLKDSAKSMGVDDADRMDPDEVVDAVQHTQTDSETSPSGWKAEEEEGDGS